MRDGFHYKFWVYILSSRWGALYVGITGFFELRIYQHKYDSIEGFTKKYQCHRLVYYESYQDVTGKNRAFTVPPRTTCLFKVSRAPTYPRRATAKT